MDSQRKEGTISFWCNHPHRDWWRNGDVYSFGTVNYSGIVIDVMKNNNCFLEIVVVGLGENKIEACLKIPVCDSRGMLVVITWSIASREIVFYINGIQAGSQSY